MTQCGVVTFCGAPNVGKSSLLNYLLQEKLSIVSHKAQTTRKNFTGIISNDQYQMIILDSPGWQDRAQKLGRFMQEETRHAIADADILCALFAVDQRPNRGFIKFLKQFNKPLYLIVTKVDLREKMRIREGELSQAFPSAEIIPLSIITREGCGMLLQKLVSALPTGPFLYPADQVAVSNLREIAAEIIRESALSQLHEEIPHQMAVVVDNYKENENPLRIEARIIVNQNSQKGMVIGSAGKKIKIIGQKARQELEQVLQKKIYLDLQVSVDKGWITDPIKLAKYGFN